VRGASSRIGVGMAIALTEEGAQVALAARHSVIHKDIEAAFHKSANKTS
jgi:NADP-dependent 3-hydroxy acid dehydrogenase YdfG